MLLTKFLHAQTDRLIAIGRVAIAFFALAAMWMDPSQPAAAPEVTYSLLSAYLAFAVSILLASRLDSVWSSDLAVVAHLVDLSVFSTLMFLTEGPTSPFFIVFTFSLVSATLQWRWKGALWTAIAVIVLLVVIVTLYRLLPPEVPFELNRFVMRCAHIVVIGAMLVYVGFRYERITDEATRLAAWQPDPSRAADLHSLLELCLAHVADVLEAPRVVLVLNDNDEPWPSVSVWDRGTFRCERLTGDVEGLVAKPLTGSAFIQTAHGIALVGGHVGRLQPWHGTAIGPALAGYNLKQALSVPIGSDHATGWLFVADRLDFAHEHLVLAKLLAAQVAMALDRRDVIATERQTAAVEERLRLARDLHDGVLQSLSGTSLQLEAIKDLINTDPAAVAARIDRLQAWLSTEQRSVRNVTRALRPGVPDIATLSEEPTGLAALARHLRQHWGAVIEVSSRAAVLNVPAQLVFDVHQIVREAVSNAVRHGGASTISVDAYEDDGRLSLVISDDGCGLVQKGRFDDSQCADQHIGPHSVLERVAGLGGSLVMDSRCTGLVLSIDLPVKSLERSQ